MLPLQIHNKISFPTPSNILLINDQDLVVGLGHGLSRGP